MFGRCASPPTAAGALHNLDPTAAYTAHWFDPRTGKTLPILGAFRAPSGIWTVPEKLAGDWVLVVRLV